MQTQATAPLSQLTIDPANIRKTEAAPDEHVIATIRAKGIISPLVVRPNAKGYYVSDGGIRLASLNKMRETEDTAAGVTVNGDYQVPIVIRQESESEARETSLMVSVTPIPAHPVAQYEAFFALTQGPKPLSADDIGVRFGIPRKQVDQTLALGALSPKVRQAWRDGKIKPEAAQAFTLAPKHKDQDQIFDKLMKAEAFRYGNSGHEVRRAIVGDRQGDAAKFINFVGVQAYEAAGGKVVIDLFREQHHVSDPALAKKLADEKVAATCADLVVSGWSWARPDDDIKDKHRYGTINKKPKYDAKETARVKEIDATLKQVDEGEIDDDDSIDALRDEVDRMGYEAEARAFSAKEKGSSGCAVEIGRDGKLTITYGLTEPVAQKDQASTRSSSSPGRVLASTGQPAKAKSPTMLSNALKQRLQEQLAKATQTALTTETFKDKRAPLYARIIAGLIEPGRLYGTPSSVSNKLAEIRNGITPKVMKAALLKHFDAKDYFSSAPKGIVLKAIEEAVNADEARKVKGKTKAEIWKFAIANVPKTSWLPPELRWAGYAGPGGKAKSKAKGKK